ncbi:hypothetical protein FACS1894184_04120 [Clostridia bacterium]|nr:hypothetical protein FACS1894184_04120 [Clostridia bacterium]
MPALTEPTTIAEPKLSFEDGLEQLESLLKRMETQQLTLDEAMSAYADGMRLSRALDEQLNQTEKQLTLLSLDGKTVSVEDGI